MLVDFLLVLGFAAIFGGFFAAYCLDCEEVERKRKEAGSRGDNVVPFRRK